ncbi:MAG: aldo/keto reductase [Pseudomonadales bacterium]|jgi:aryl-alcohol dehydrogenase-like predicted oxidoreductase|nr:aldo/keto reductase [Pseudomonadales bacterium]
MVTSLLGLGTVKFGRSTGLRYPRPFALPDDAAVARLLDRARELGVNLLDTAPAYGEAETRLGRLLRGRREEFLLVTKCGERFDGRRSHFDFSAAHTTASVHASLRRLRTDRLDCVLLHSDGDDAALLEDGAALEALARLKRSGELRSYGISTKTVAGSLAALGRVDVLMITLSPRRAEDVDLARRAGAQGCGVLVKKALDSGHVGDPAAALRSVATCTGVGSIVVGTLDPAHLAANAAALAGTPADPEPKRR